MEDFNFMRHILRGEAAPKPRWQKCVELVDEQLGDALGRLYVEKYFTVERASRVQSLAAAMKQGMMTEIAALAWPTVETKQQALQKVEAFAINIGYPKRWADYSGFKVLRGDALGNYQRGKVLRHELEWDMTVPSANAYYDLEQNALFLPAGILQAPLFDPSFDEAVNYGATATMVGHEMTHAFDDEGRKYDKNGDLHDWWSARDVQKYDRYAQCLVDQYSDYAVAGGGKLNGRLTLGENMADLAGTRLAFRVFEATAAASGSATPYRMTPEQRFFLAFAKSYCTKETPETTLLRIRSDPHSIEKYRVNGALSNVPEFRDAFACPKGAPMVRENICRPH
jgi:endothelin-converting enzyme/putative endopeptidase